MSKKMWHNIFKSKSQKTQLKINRRHSRGFYEEYQQQSELLNDEKSSGFHNEIDNVHASGSRNVNENENENRNENENKNGNNGQINVFEQQPQQSSFNSATLNEAQQLHAQQTLQHQQHQHLSTFSRVRNTLFSRHSSKKRVRSAKSINMEHSEADENQNEEPTPSPKPLTSGMPIPIPEQVQSNTELTPCPNCSRTFNVKALQKHVVVCEKMSKKRKVFDSSRQRREGTSLSTYVLPKNFGMPNAEKAAGLHTPPSVSRETSSVLTGSQQQPQEPSASTSRKSKGNSGFSRNTARGSMRNAAGATQGAELTTDGSTGSVTAAAPSSLNRERLRSSDRSLAKRIKDVASNRCPHCDRSFNPKAFDRHVTWCKEKAIQATIKSVNTTETNKAKERMEARKQYRPPNLKTKRSINRDKYSGTFEEQQYEENMVAQKQQYNQNQNQMTLSAMTSSMQSESSQKKRPGTPKPKTDAVVIQNTFKMSINAEANNSNSSLDQPQRSTVRSLRKQYDTCQEIDGTVERLRRAATAESVQVANLECVDAPPLQPYKPRRAVALPQKVDNMDQCLSTPRAAMTFEDLNGLFKQSTKQAGTKVCNIQMEMPGAEEFNQVSKMRSSTSLVRQARRRIRTRENPSIDLRSLTPPKALDVMSNDSLTSVDREDYDPLPAPVQFQQKRQEMYFDTEEESFAPCREIKIKLEASSIRTTRLPKKDAVNLPPIELKPVSEPQRPLSSKNMNLKLDHIPSHKQRSEMPNDDMEDYEGEGDLQAEYDGADLEVCQLLREEQLGEPHDCYTEEYEKPMQEQPRTSLQKPTPSVTRRLVVLEQDGEGTMYIKAPPSPTKRHPKTPPLVNSGLGPFTDEKYDPFLSAKRQLEELCSPITLPDNNLDQSTSPSVFMSSSLTTALETQNKPTTPFTVNQTKVPTSSNFRRTSSLRGPRRSPLLPSRPLFVTNYRPTIQRGLSDEGPISSSFLKPEEYDEMPVRAVCGNDFHSPLVVRRDTSSSNRKQQQLKLPVGGTNETLKPTSRQVANTDSLAVFLKYEHELEQPSTAEMVAVNKELNTKELKDKSNILSKQNSAKSLAATSAGTPLLPPLTSSKSSAPPHIPNENMTNNLMAPTRLAPIKLESIFGNNQMEGRDFIDPNLINPCDNLHMFHPSTSSSSDASSTPQQKSAQNRESSESINTLFQEQPKRRHSGINLLKRKMRLGRNQFLYDASPEDHEQLPEHHPQQQQGYISCTTDRSGEDEAKRLSLKSDEQCWQQQQKLLSMTPTMPTLPVLPPFDDFDFDEFLSSFENDNDDGEFPLFRDCREFILNRATNRQRTFQKVTSTPLTPLLTHTQMQVNPTATLRPATSGNASSQLLSSLSTKESHTHRSDSNVSSSGGSFKLPSSSNGSYMTPQTSGSSYKTPPTSGDEKLQMQQQSNAGRNPLEDTQKREIFISIETEANAQGRSPISPDTLRNMVGNMQTPIDVLDIENGNEPEHAVFSKIIDTEDHLDAELDVESSRNLIFRNRLNSTASTAATFPNVEANNVKNALEKMRNEFKQVGASMQQKQQGQRKQNEPKASSQSGDSDELSSLDGYPMSSSYSSRRGASAKLSSDSAYGSNTPYSLSRQRSGEMQQSSNTPRSQNEMNPLSNTKIDASTQAQSKYGSLKARQRLFSSGGAGDGCHADACNEQSSSSSEHSLTPAVPQSQHQKQSSNYNANLIQQKSNSVNSSSNSTNNNNNNNNNNSSNNNNNNNHITAMTPTTSQHSLLSNISNTSSGISASSKMSKFCHECGGKFILEHAKFCMECGVKRVVL